MKLNGISLYGCIGRALLVLSLVWICFSRIDLRFPSLKTNSIQRSTYLIENRDGPDLISGFSGITSSITTMNVPTDSIETIEVPFLLEFPEEVATGQQFKVSFMLQIDRIKMGNSIFESLLGNQDSSDYQEQIDTITNELIDLSLIHISEPTRPY